MAKRFRLYILFVFCILAGLATLIPYPGASEKSILGYKSLCSFSPISTVLLIYGAYLVFHKIKKDA